jgi:PBSX family phage terminase large subunit
MVTLTKKQKKAYKTIFSNQYTEILFDGAARAGKTYLIIYCLIIYSILFPGIRILITRAQLSHAISSIWLQTLLPLLETYFNTKTPTYQINRTMHIVTFNNGSEIWIGGLDNKERVDKILGQEYAIIFNNEVVQLSKNTYGKVRTRLAQKIKGLMNFIINDCNPRSPSHWIYKRFYTEKPKNSYKLTWITEENLDNISKDFLNQLEELSETQRLRFLKGIWCDVEGSVYNNIFDTNIINVSKDWGKYDDVVIGIDWGYHMHASVWGIKEGKKLQAFCMYEFVIIGGKTTDLIREMDKVGWLERYKAHCDHELDRISELVDNNYMADKAHKEVGAGDSSVNEYELYFDVKCPETFQSMLNLMHQQDREGNYIYLHEKVNDHGADSARYALHGWRKDNGVKTGHFFIRR